MLCRRIAHELMLSVTLYATLNKASLSLSRKDLSWDYFALSQRCQHVGSRKDLSWDCLLVFSICWFPRGGGGGGVFWYFHTYVGSGNFWGSKFWISIFIGVFRKMNIFWGMQILWIFFGVITKLGHIKWLFLCILGSFLSVKVQNGRCF